MPPQPGVAEIAVKPAGIVSVKLTPVNVTVLFVLAIVKVRVVLEFSGIVAAPNTLVIEGGATTVMLAEAVPPIPPLLETTLLVVLFSIPALMPVTLTAKVQPAPPASAAPDRLMLVDPAVAVIVPPLQLPVRPLGVATIKP
ncbi:MAG TPA: hypothetical protein VEE85_01200, partial [Candidatus Bathyarchaeia archaeon]|nr:hypothetical protein [Candidatus Bathyarchaeia archaeon]